MSVNQIDFAESSEGVDDIRDRYDRDGYFIFRGVLDDDTVSGANRHIDWLLDTNPDRQPHELGHDLARKDRFWYDLVADPRLLDIAETFIGSDIALFATHYICKQPMTGREVRWHQDGAFWPLDPMDVVTLWVAVTQSTPENGCLKIVPGSHHTSLMDMVPTDSGNAVLAEEIPVEVDENEAIPLELRPGDVSVHHPNIIHGSDMNRSPDWRRGLTIRYIPTSTRILEADAASPFLLRGAAVEGLNDYLPAPEMTDGDRGFVA